MHRVRPEVELLARDRRYYESCDEGAVGQFAKVELAGLKLKDGTKVSSLHLSWRQPVVVVELNPNEEKLLMTAGYDVRVDDEYPYVRTLEKRFRHRYLAWLKTGWVLSTAERGDNLQDLVAVDAVLIPTLDLPVEAGPIIALHDLYRTLKEDLKKHGVFTEFFGHQERMFQILGRLVTEMRASRERSTDSPRAEADIVHVGRVSVTGTDR